MENQQLGVEAINPNGQNSNGESSQDNNRASLAQLYSTDAKYYTTMDADSYFDDEFPPGYRFKPYDPELVVCYLQKKVKNEPLPQNRIKEVELYKFNPETLTEIYKPLCDKEWYFFTPRDRKYKNGKRPNRAAADGYWKATGADKRVQYNDVVVGFKKALVFYRGKPPKGDKTNWIMHEFRVNTPPRVRSSGDDMRLDDWVLCRIYKKKEKDRSRRSSTGLDDDSLQDDQESESEYQDNGVIDMAPENYMPQDPGFMNMSGYVNQGRFFNPYDDNAFMYPQSAFHNHIGRLPEGIPQYNSNYNPGLNSVGFPTPSSTWVQQPFSGSDQNLDLEESPEAAAAAATRATSQPMESNMKLEQINEYHETDQYWDVP